MIGCCQPASQNEPCYLSFLFDIARATMTPRGVLHDVRNHSPKYFPSRTFQARQSGRHRSRNKKSGGKTDFHCTTFGTYQTSEKHDPPLNCLDRSNSLSNYSIVFLHYCAWPFQDEGLTVISLGLPEYLHCIESTMLVSKQPTDTGQDEPHKL